MGLLRLLLALSVFFAHAPVPHLLAVGPELAVQAFFIISGFYIALVLRTRQLSPGLFFANRLLRLYPSYWIVLGLALLREALLANRHHSLLASTFGKLGIVEQAYLIFSQLTMVGLDAGMFLGTSDGQTFHFVASFMSSSPYWVHRLFLVPQAWSISLEIMFYALAPWLIRRSPLTLTILCALSLLTRAAAYRAGLNYDPWTYRFFPFEIALFVFGVLAYRAYETLRPLIESSTLRRRFLSALLVGFTFSYPVLPSFPGKSICFLGLVIVALPWLFHEVRNNRIDRWIGELSYPIYVSHNLCYVGLQSAQSVLQLGPNGFLLVATLLTFGFSVFLLMAVEIPMSRLRAKLTSLRLEPRSSEKQVIAA